MLFHRLFVMFHFVLVVWYGLVKVPGLLSSKQARYNVPGLFRTKQSRDLPGPLEIDIVS
jgi:hypothetical protein